MRIEEVIMPPFGSVQGRLGGRNVPKRVEFIADSVGSGTSTTNQQISIPSHWDGDLILVSSASNSTTAPTLPVGWTNVHTVTNTGSGFPRTIRVLYIISDGSITTLNVTGTTTSGTRGSACMIFRNAASVGAFTGFSASSGTSTSRPFNAVTLQNGDGTSVVVGSCHLNIIASIVAGGTPMVLGTTVSSGAVMARTENVASFVTTSFNPTGSSERVTSTVEVRGPILTQVFSTLDSARTLVNDTDVSSWGDPIAFTPLTFAPQYNQMTNVTSFTNALGHRLSAGNQTLSVATSGFTVVCYAVFTGTPAEYETLFNASGASNFDKIIFCRNVATSGILFQIFNGATQVGLLAPTNVIVQNQLAVFVARYRAYDLSMTIFKNDVIVGTGSASPAVANRSNVPTSAGGNLTGGIQGLYIYSQSLADEEITNISIHRFGANFGAVRAYSLRRLFTTYAGPVVRVRRSSDSLEQSFWADTTTATLSSSALAKRWTDLDASSRTLTGTDVSSWGSPIAFIGTGTTAPEYIAADDVVRFTRANSDFLNAGTQTLAISTSGFTAICMVRFTGTAGNYERIFDFSAPSTGEDGILLCRNGSTRTLQFAISNGTTDIVNLLAADAIVQNELMVVVVRYRTSDNSAQMYKNNELIASQTGIAAVPDRTLAQYIGTGTGRSSIFMPTYGATPSFTITGIGANATNPSLTKATYEISCNITAATTGTLYETGGSGTGIVIYMYNGTLYAQAGSGTSGVGNVELSYALGATTVTNIIYSVDCVNKAQLFVNYSFVSESTNLNFSSVAGTNGGGTGAMYDASIAATRAFPVNSTNTALVNFANGTLNTTRVFQNVALYRVPDTYFNGDIRGLFISDSALTDTEIQNVIQSKFGMAGVTGPEYDAFVGAGTGYVSQLMDQTGQGYHATQATAASQPWIVRDASWTSAPTIRCGGVGFLGYDCATNAIVNTNYTVAVTTARTNSDLTNFFLGGTSGTTNQNLYLGYRNTSFTHAQQTNDYDMTIPAYSVPTSETYVVRHSSTFAKNTYKNGTLLGSGASTTALSAYAGAQIGRYATSTPYQGDVSSLILFNTYLSDRRRQIVEADLASFAGVSTAYAPLDIISSSAKSTCVAAYSFRKTSSTYTGPVVRIRNGTTNEESDFFAEDLSIGAALDTFLAGSVAYVTIWYDQSGSNNDAFNSTTTSQPTLVRNATWTTQATIRFQGAQLLTFTGSSLVNTEYSVAVSTARSSNKSLNYFIAGTTGSSNQNLHLGYRTDTTATHDQFSNNYNMTVPAYASQTPGTYVFRHSSSIGKNTYKNAKLLGSNTNLSNLTAYAGAAIGRFYRSDTLVTSYYIGDISEVIMLNSYLSDVERLSLDLNMMSAL